LLSAAVTVALGAPLAAQVPASPPGQPAAGPAPPAGVRPEATAPDPRTIPAGVAVPPGYLIGPEDVLSIVYWKDKDMSTDVAVRPDGKISVPLLNEIQAAGLTPEQLREKLVEQSKKYIEDPSVTVVVKTINSRKVFITGEVGKPGPYALTSPTTVLQLIALAGGLRDYADSKKIVIVRTENGRQMTYKFNYKEVSAGRKLQQNIELKPNDTIVVP
jgi:polysaccharide export outer membrane protein